MTSLSLVKPNIPATPSRLSWLKDITIDVSFGEADFAAVTRCEKMLLVEFVNIQIKHQRIGLLSESEYTAAEKPVRDAEKGQFGWFSLAKYHDHHRNKSNWRGTNVVVLDADAKCGEIESAEFSFTREQLRDRLAGLLFIALPTHSYTSEMPRWRILIPLNERVSDREEFSRITQHLADQVDGYVDGRSFLPEQLWFNFSTPAGEWDTRKSSILISPGEDAEVFDVHTWRTTQTKPKDGMGSGVTNALLTHADAPLAESPENVERVKQMLAAVDPDPGDAGTREQWYRIVWAVASLGWDCGESLAREWSRAGDKYDEAEFSKVWTSFKPDGGIGIGTLRHHAVEGGWVDVIRASGDMEGDLLNAQLFARVMNNQILFNHTREKWHLYNGGRWMLCEKGEEVQAARQVVRKIIEFSVHKISLLPTGDPKRKDWIRHLLRSQSLNAVDAMLKLAQSEDHIATKQAELDSNPWLLACTNGVIDLHAGALLAHDPAMKITRMVRANYNRAAQCPRFMRFLSETFANDSETIGAIKRMVGYSLLGVLLEEVFFFAYGTGANGKSVFFNVLVWLLADYAITVPTATLMVKRDGEGSTNDLARMMGARFAVANETKTGDKLDDQKLKLLASRDPISARYLYKEFFDFEPSATVWVRGNHKPIVTDDSDGLWRRLMLIPFTRTIPEQNRDPQLTDKLMQEADGILSWAVEGCLEYQRYGLKPSPAMKQASAEYRKEADILGEWLETHCEIVPAEKTEQKSAYQRYRWFCGNNGVHPMTKMTFTRKLSERNFPGAYIGKSRAYSGFKLREVTGWMGG